jgi:hypothetical protein
MSWTEIRAKTPQAHDRIQQWRHANPSGFIVKVKNHSVGNLHRSDCRSHFGDTDWPEGRPNWGSLGNTTKILAHSVEDARAWAKQSGSTLVRCRDCNP